MIFPIFNFFVHSRLIKSDVRRSLSGNLLTNRRMQIRAGDFRQMILSAITNIGGSLQTTLFKCLD